MECANLQNCTTNYLDCKHLANGIVNEILDRALEIALSVNYDIKDATKKIVDDMQEVVVSRKICKIIDEFSRTNAGDYKNEQPPELEEKEMPLSIRKNSVGDLQNDDLQNKSSKSLEKKSRITDLLMNVNKPPNNLLDEKERKKQEDWEEGNENVIQVIELQGKESRTVVCVPIDDNETNLLEMAHDTVIEKIDPKGGEGDDRKVEEIEKEDSIEGSQGEKPSDGKKKKWNFRFKFFGLRKKRSKQSKSAPTTLVDN